MRTESTTAIVPRLGRLIVHCFAGWALAGSLAGADFYDPQANRDAPKPFRELWGVPGPPNAPDFPAPQTFTKDNYHASYQDPADDWGLMGGMLRGDDMGANLENVACRLRNLAPQDVADITAWLLSQTIETTAAPKPVAQLSGAFSVSDEPLATLEKPGRLILTQGDATFGEFVFIDATVHRPFFANLRAPGGIQITRNFPPVNGQDPMDHADMHPRLWLGFGDLAGEEFWRNQGTILHSSENEQAPDLRSLVTP